MKTEFDSPKFHKEQFNDFVCDCFPEVYDIWSLGVCNYIDLHAFVVANYSHVIKSWYEYRHQLNNQG